MSDNRIFNVNGRTLEQLTLTLKLALLDEYGENRVVRGWKFSKTHGLILLWSADNEKANKFPVALDYEKVAPIVWDWLTKTKDAEQVPFEGWDINADHDGDNEKGWRVYCEDWGHVDSDPYAIVAIRPAYLWYGK